MIVTLEEALSLARAELSEVTVSGENQKLWFTGATRFPSGWVFFYEGSAFVEKWDWRYKLGGNLPIHVSLEGNVRLLTVEELAELERSADARVRRLGEKGSIDSKSRE